MPRGYEDVCDIKKRAFRDVCRYWIIGVLCFTVVALITFILTNRIGKGDNLLKGIENFSTVLSIILSITSILYTTFTSHDTSRQLSATQCAVGEIREASNIIAKNNSEMLQVVLNITKDIAEIRTNVQKQSLGIQTDTSKLLLDNIPSNM